MLRRNRVDPAAEAGEGTTTTRHRAYGPVYGLTRATTTLLAAAAAGFLVWIATQLNAHTTGGYWAIAGIIAGAGLVMAISQLLGGWTKWGWPRMSAGVFWLAFVPVLIVAGWVIVSAQPHNNWARQHILSWTGDIHVRGLVNDLKAYIPLLAFGIGLVFGYTFDTTGPRVVEPLVTERPASARVDRGRAMDREAANDPTSAERADGAGTPGSRLGVGAGRVGDPPYGDGADRPSSPASHPLGQEPGATTQTPPEL